MRKPIVAGNWKMNKTVADANQLVMKLVQTLPSVDKVEKVLCPPFTALMHVSEITKNTGILLGAQNMYWEEKGAFTGEIAPNMIAEFCDYVILGHSERRMYFGETDININKKVKAALANNLTPIICVGETLEENQENRTAEVVTRQIQEALKGLDNHVVAKTVIAYEPIWAIGTGLPATPEGANQVISDYIRAPIANLYGENIAEEVRVQYGGSVKPGNAAEYFAQPDIDGALVGGASLSSEDFFGIVKAASS